MIQTILNRLIAISSTIMGEAWSPEQERILCILPFPEPTELLANIEKIHPNVKFIYKSLALPDRGNMDQKLIDECTLP
jgi:hypothetical protein